MKNGTGRVRQVRSVRYQLAWGLCLALGSGWLPLTTLAAPVTHEHVRQGDVDIEFTLSGHSNDKEEASEVTAGTDARATLHLRDLRTGQPLTGVHPKAWMALRRSEMVAGETTCADKVKGFLSGNLSARADVDFNSSLLVVLNHDKTISIINPQIAMSRTKLESMIQLPGVGADWVLAHDKNHLYVTMPDQAAVAVIDTSTRKIERQIPTGAEGQPRRIALHPNGRHVWIGLDGSTFVGVIDTDTNELKAKVPVGRGLHSMMFTPDRKYMLVTNSEQDSVSIVDTATLKPIREISVGKTPVAVATSQVSGHGYVALLNDSRVAVLDMEKQEILSIISTKAGTTVLQMEPEGRFLFALNQRAHAVSVIDTTTNEIVATSPVVKEPDQISFTRQFAYIRGLGSEKVSLIELGELRKGRLVPVEVQIGQSAPEALPDQIGVAAMMVPAPEGHGMMIASAPDKTIYYYMEGMMVPMGTFQTYQRFPRALMVLDRSLTETTPGTYSATVRLAKEAGRFDVPVFIDHPRVVSCLQVAVTASSESATKHGERELDIEPLFTSQAIAPGPPTSLQFRVTDTKSKQPVNGLTDLQVLIFQPPGTWQHRSWGRDVGNGVYEVTQQFPRNGMYRVMVRVPSKGVKFNSKLQTTVIIGEKAQTPSVPDHAAKRN